MQPRTLTDVARALVAARPRDAREAADVALLRELSASDSVWDRTRPVHVTASAVVAHPPTRRVLLRWHEILGGWFQVGGHGDPGETDPLAVALRECREETGLLDARPWPDPDCAALLHVVVVDAPATGDMPTHRHGDLRYLLSTDRPQDALAESPRAPVRWVEIDRVEEVVEEENLRETLRRARELLTGRP